MLQPGCFQCEFQWFGFQVGAPMWAVGGSHGLGTWMGLRHLCVSMSFVRKQGAHGDSPGCKGQLLAHPNPVIAAGGHSQLLKADGLGESLQSCVTFPQPSRELPFAGGIVPGQTLQGRKSINITAGQRGITFPLPYFIFSFSFQPGSLSITKRTSQAEQPISPHSCACLCVCVCNHFSPLSEDKAGL